MQSWAARSKTWQLSTTVSLDFHLQPDLKHNGFTELRRQRLELMEAMIICRECYYRRQCPSAK